MNKQEQAILGYMIINSSLDSDLLGPDLFEDLTNRKIYMKIREFKDIDVPINEPALVEALDGEVDTMDILDCNQGFSKDMASIPLWFDQGVKFLYRSKAFRDMKNYLVEYSDDPLIEMDKLKDFIFRIEENVTQGVISTKDAIELFKSEIEDDSSLISLGFPGIDRAIGGLRKGEVVQIMARTTVGKTWILLNILCCLVSHYKEKIAFFSLEMPITSLIERLFQLIFDVSRDETKQEAKNPESIQYFEERFGNVVFSDGISSVSEIETKAKMNKAGIIMIDYIQLIRSSSKGNQYEQVTDTMTRIKQLAKTTNSVVILIGQLSRAAEDGSIPVTLNMGRDSGALEEQSDYILGAWRPELNDNNRGPKDENRIYIKLLKNKKGDMKLIKCNFNKKTGKILEIDDYMQTSGEDNLDYHT